MDNFNKTQNIYPNLNALNANISNEQQFRLKKLMKLNIILLLRLEKENYLAKILVSILLL